MGLSRQEYWSGLPFPSPADPPDPGIKPGSPKWQGDHLPSEPPGKLRHGQSCPTPCDPRDCRLPGSSLHGIFLARILECIAISSFRGSSCPRDRTHSSCTGRWVIYHCTTWEAPESVGLEPQRFKWCSQKLPPAQRLAFTTDMPFLPWHFPLDTVFKMSLVSVYF